MTENPSPDASIDAEEVAQFDALAGEWWNPDGKLRPLHRINPARLEYLRDRMCRHFGRDPLAPRVLDGLDILDIGCGGGLICEPLGRLGARVTGIDPSHKTIGAAQAHARTMALAIDYRATTAAALAAEGARFDAVLALEVVEHVADLDAFLAALAELTRPGGMAVIATLNRTVKSFAFAIVGAEYVLGWLPRGTHDWNRFLRPSELTAALRRAGLTVTDLTGVAYHVPTDTWRIGRDLGVNYMATAVKD